MSRALVLPVLPVLLCCALPALAAEPAAADTGEGPEAAAERALQAGRHEEVLAHLFDAPDTPRSRFLRAYAHFKLGDLELATALLDSLLERGFSAEAALLKGMIALKQGQPEQALPQLEAVVASGEAPWASTAAELATRARERLAALEARRLAEQQAAEERDFKAGLDRTEALIKAGQLKLAVLELDRLEELRPGRMMPRYYRGYVAYKRGDYGAARARLEEALAIAPEDEWARYMLALTRQRLGEEDHARGVLASLAGGARSTEVRQESRRALEEIRRTRQHGDSLLGLQLDVGTGLDTNPAFLDELPAAPESAGLAVHLGGRLDLRYWFIEALGGALTLDLRERLYAVGDMDYAGTDISPRADLRLRIGRVALDAGYRFTFSLLGHRPLLSTHAGVLDAGVEIRPWLVLAVGGRAAWSPVHNQDYIQFQGLDARGEVSVRLQRGRWNAAASYSLNRFWAETVETTFTPPGQKGGSSPGGGKGSGSGSGSGAVTYDFITDYSFIGHGPLLWGRVSLPWKLSLEASLGLQQWLFNHSDVLVEPGGGAQKKLDPRQDLRLAARVELSRALPVGLELALRYQSLDNFSTLSSREHGLDRSYSRREVVLSLSWSWSR